MLRIIDKLFCKSNFIKKYYEGNGSFGKAFICLAILPLLPVIYYLIYKDNITSNFLAGSIMAYVVLYAFLSRFFICILVRNVDNQSAYKLFARWLVRIYGIMLVPIVVSGILLMLMFICGLLFKTSISDMSFAYFLIIVSLYCGIYRVVASFYTARTYNKLGDKK